MIDNRFSLVPSVDINHLLNITFSVILPLDRCYTTQDSIVEEAQRQYPELIFEFFGGYSAKFPDGQYAQCIKYLKVDSRIVELIFRICMDLTTILQATTGFKKYVKPLQFTVNPAELSTITPEEFLEIVSDMYAELSIFIKVTEVSWTFDHVDSTNESVYSIQPTEYAYV